MLQRALVAARALRMAPVAARAMSSVQAPFPHVYDPRADENWEPPAREVVRMPRFADFRSDTGE